MIHYYVTFLTNCSTYLPQETITIAIAQTAGYNINKYLITKAVVQIWAQSGYWNQLMMLRLLI